MTTTPAVAAENQLGLTAATANAGALWTALARTRGHELARCAGFIAVNGGERAGLRVLMLTRTPNPEDVSAIVELVRRALPGRVTVEDPFSVVDLTELGLTARQLPIMVRHPAPASGQSAKEISRIETGEQLAVVERLVVDGFPLEQFQPHRVGEAFPRALLGYPGVDLFLVEHKGTPVGGCLTVVDGNVGGVYWVTTVPEHRSRGIGRALMHAVLDHLDGRPVTLTAARAGKPLYDSLGFQAVGQSTWWA